MISQITACHYPGIYIYHLIEAQPVAVIAVAVVVAFAVVAIFAAAAVVVVVEI